MSDEVFSRRVRWSGAAAAVSAADPKVFWVDRPGRPRFEVGAGGVDDADLVIIGGGFTGLWAAVIAAERQPGRRIVVLEAKAIGDGASSRNGGFCEASLTHGVQNGAAHWPNEMETLVRLGDENLKGLLSDLQRLGIDCGAEPVGSLVVAVDDWQLDELAGHLGLQQRYGRAAKLLDRDELATRLRSPIALGGLLTEGTMALVDPGRLVWGLAEAARDLGVEIRERAPVSGAASDGSGLMVRAGPTTVRADRVVSATNAWAAPSKAMRRRIVPVYDHVLVTEPLSARQLSDIGWPGREGVSDAGNQFHYYRLTNDNRVLWGGYDANYHFGSRVDRRHEHRKASFELLAEHFFQAFPQLNGLRFSHRWAGPIATTARFTAAWGREFDGRLAWVGGYTGLGVGASRFGATVALDLVDGLESERTELEMVRAPPFPFPPEPFRWPAIQLTRRAIVRSDRRQGRRGPWLSLLDRFGVGFNS